MISSAFDSETRTLLQETIARFCRAQSSQPGHGTWAGLAENGWLALGLPEHAGGSGAAIGDVLHVMRASGAGLWREPLIETLGLACGALMAVSPTPARDDLLGKISQGTAVVGMAGAPADAGPPKVKARRHNDGAWVLTGPISPAVHGRTWDVILVPAAAEEGFGLFAVDAHAPGLIYHDIETIDGRAATALALNGTPGTALMVEAAHVLAAARRRGYVLAAAEAAGIARAALDATIAYLALRRQFDQPLIQFQALRHRLADMHIRLCEMDALLDAVCMAYDRAQDSAHTGPDSPDLDRLILRLHARCAASVIWITQQAIQLHGGMGMTRALPIGAYYKRALFINSLFGGYEGAIDRLSMMLNFPEHDSKGSVK